MGIEEIAGADFFLAVVLAEVEEVEDSDICGPGLDVDCEGSWPLVATLVDVAGSCVVCTKHRYDAVRVTIGAGNVRAEGSG